MKKAAILILIIVSMFLVSCSGQQGVQKNTGAFKGGIDGLKASFEPLSIKEDNVFTIFDSEDFPIDIRLKNKGEETLSPGKVSMKLLGPAPQDFEGIPSWTIQNKEDIEKVSEFNPDGGEETISFTSSSRAKYKNKVTGYTDINWNLEYAYDYKTYLIVDDVCFKGDITDTKICDIKTARTFSVSGAPITVTSINEESGGKGIVVLRIQIKNAGTGKSTITGKEFDTRFDQVGFTVDEPEKWECKSSGRENEARLSEVGTSEIQCRLKAALKDEDLYTRSVRLTFDYTYKELVQEKLRIKESIK